MDFIQKIEFVVGVFIFIILIPFFRNLFSNFDIKTKIFLWGILIIGIIGAGIIVFAPAVKEKVINVRMVK